EQVMLEQIDKGSAYNMRAITAEDRILAPRFTDALPLSTLLSTSSLKV
ncbi:transposase, partial [Vibrio sp. F13]